MNMDIADPHRGRKMQTDEVFDILWMTNNECALNLTLLHHFESLGWRFSD